MDPFSLDQTDEFFTAFSRAAEQSLTALYQARNGPPPTDDCLLRILKPNGLTPVKSDAMHNVIVWYDEYCEELMPSLERRRGCVAKKR